MTRNSLKSFITGVVQSDSINFHVFFSTSSFLDSSSSFKPVIKGKLIVNTNTHTELSQLVIVSQNFTSFKL